MNADAIYVFTKHPACRTRYIEAAHTGADIAGFPACYARGAYKGRRYIGFREKVEKRAGHRNFTHCVELEGARMCTGLNFDSTTPDKAFGDYAGCAVLVELSGAAGAGGINRVKGKVILR